jgi:DNA-binding NarL/FixJ family response regulator
MKRIRIALVEDKREMRESLQEFIDGTEGFSCSGAYPNAEVALKELPWDLPDVVLMDLNLPRADGVECTAKVKAAWPNVKVLVLTVYEDASRIFEALKAGADGYLLKKTEPEELLKSLREVMRGGAPMSSEVAARVVSYFHERGKAQSQTDALSRRELEVLSNLAKGLLYKEIADALGISYDTVNFHVKNIYQKLHVRSRCEAVAKFLTR